MNLDIDIAFLKEAKPHVEAAFKRGNLVAQTARQIITATMELAEPFLESDAKHPMPSDESFGLAKAQLRQDFKQAKAFTGNKQKEAELSMAAGAYASIVRLQVTQLTGALLMKSAS